MKLNKALLIAALAAGSLFTSGIPSQAQDNTNTPPAGGPGMRGRPNLDLIAKDLNLTDDQKAKLKTIMEDQQTKMKALRADTSLSKEDKQAKAKEIRDAAQTQIKAILTPEQLTKWQAHMQRSRPPGSLGGNAAPGAPAQK